MQKRSLVNFRKASSSDCSEEPSTEEKKEAVENKSEGDCMEAGIKKMARSKRTAKKIPAHRRIRERLFLRFMGSPGVFLATFYAGESGIYASGIHRLSTQKQRFREKTIDKCGVNVYAKSMTFEP